SSRTSGMKRYEGSSCGGSLQNDGNSRNVKDSTGRNSAQRSWMTSIRSLAHGLAGKSRSVAQCKDCSTISAVRFRGQSSKQIIFETIKERDCLNQSVVSWMLQVRARFRT